MSSSVLFLGTDAWPKEESRETKVLIADNATITSSNQQMEKTKNAVGMVLRHFEEKIKEPKKTLAPKKNVQKKNSVFGVYEQTHPERKPKLIKPQTFWCYEENSSKRSGIHNWKHQA